MHYLFKRILSKGVCIRNFRSSVKVSSKPDDSYQPDEHVYQQALYDGHIPTSRVQKAVLAIGSAVMSLADPYRHDMIAVLSETTGLSSAKGIREKMLLSTEGSLILKEKPRINTQTLDFTLLASLPEGTLGNAYLTFLNSNNVTPDSRREVHYVDDSDLAYIIQRYREIHDLNHTLLGMPTHMLGEVTVKWVEAIQTKLPMCVSAALLGPLRLKPKHRKKYLETYLPWAIQCGHESKFLMNVYFENRWHQNVDDLKRELNIPPLMVV